MYAEALNELTPGVNYDIPSWDGAMTYQISRDKEEMRTGIKPVRMRAGVPDFADDIYSDQDKFRIYLKRELMIELMGEGKRYNDLRRSVPHTGCRMEPVGYLLAEDVVLAYFSQ